MSEKLKKAQERGANIKQLANLVEVSGLNDVVKQLSDIAEENRKAQAAQTGKLIEAIETLVQVVNEKQIEGTDLSELIEAVASLKKEATVTQPLPHVWQGTIEDRDQRGFVKDFKLTPLPRSLN